VVKLDKPRDFIGKRRARPSRPLGLTRKLVGIQMVGRGIARHGYPIHAWTGSETPSGAPPSASSRAAAQRPRLDIHIGLGYVPSAHAEIGTKLGIEIRGKLVEAVVVKTPFYRRQK
jgi:aminomethyltransferase